MKILAMRLVKEGTILKTNNGGVPVELNSFSAITNGNDVILKWTTATETNNGGFEIQRNSDSLLPGEEPKGWVSIWFCSRIWNNHRIKILFISR